MSKKTTATVHIFHKHKDHYKQICHKKPQNTNVRTIAAINHIVAPAEVLHVSCIAIAKILICATTLR